MLLDRVGLVVRGLGEQLQGGAGQGAEHLHHRGAVGAGDIHLQHEVADAELRQQALAARPQLIPVRSLRDQQQIGGG